MSRKQYFPSGQTPASDADARCARSGSQGILLLNSSNAEILDANQHIADLLGTTPAELTGKSIWDLPISSGLVFDQRVSFGGLIHRPVRFDNLTLQLRNGNNVRVHVISHFFPENGNGRILMQVIEDAGAP